METPLHGSEVVVVEDDLNIARLVRHALGREGAHVRHVASVAEARQMEQPWDLVLFDRNLPDGDGIELCREIRPRNPHGYIVILTSDASSAAKLGGLRLRRGRLRDEAVPRRRAAARVRAGLRIVALQKALLASNRSSRRCRTPIR